MFQDNLIALRKMHNLSQEELAERLRVSRQTISKYETGESLPDIDKCKLLAEIFDVSLDDLVNYDKEVTGLGVPPKGKHMFGMVKVGDKGQIVIPAKARKVFQIEPGDNLIVLGDESQGMALINEREFMKMVRQFRNA
ncbi:MAG: helix-turn-helix transcriptional regulator [Clostridium sp.]|nr:helix-turn-helix transcriptional regulator [Clostridium sp.]